MQTVLVLSIAVLLLWACKAFCLQVKERTLEEEITFFSRKQSTSPPPSLCCFQVIVSISGSLHLLKAEGLRENYLLIWSRPGIFQPQPVGNQVVKQLKQAPYFCDRWFCAEKKKIHAKETCKNNNLKIDLSMVKKKPRSSHADRCFNNCLSPFKLWSWYQKLPFFKIPCKYCWVTVTNKWHFD